MAEPRGISHPFRADGTGFPAPATGLDRIGGQIRQVLLTELGERVMRPTFGSRLREYLFENLDEITLEAIRAETARALAQSDIDVLVLDIKVSLENEDNPHAPTTVVVEILYDRLGKRDTVEVALVAGRTE